MMKHVSCCMTLWLCAAICAAGQEDCIGMNDSLFKVGTTAEVTIFNGQGVVSYAKFNLQFTPTTGNDPHRLSGVAAQVFSDRKAGGQPFDINQADQLQLILSSVGCPACFNATPGDGGRSFRVSFVLLSWGKSAAVLSRLSCPSTGYITAVDGTGLYVIHLKGE